jgi:hypothetical protein
MAAARVGCLECGIQPVLRAVHPPFKPRRILVAVAPQAAKRIERALPDAGLCVVRSVDEATLALGQEPFRLAIFGLYFDESRMFELIPLARASALNRSTPILCVQGIRGRLSPPALRGLEGTIKAMGCAWLDVAAIPDDETGRASLRDSLLRHLPAEEPLPAPGFP